MPTPKGDPPKTPQPTMETPESKELKQKIILLPHQAFKPRSKKQHVEVEFTDIDTGEIKIVSWEVKALSPRLMIKHAQEFAALEGQKYEEDKVEEMPFKEQVSLMQLLAPLVDIVLPYCCIEPKVIFEGDTTPSAINIDDIELEALLKLFITIFNISGLGKKAADDKKKLLKLQ